jgi:hypothetical protein
MNCVIISDYGVMLARSGERLGIRWSGGRAFCACRPSPAVLAMNWARRFTYIDEV